MQITYKNFGYHHSLPPVLKVGSSGSKSLVYLGDGCITFSVKKYYVDGNRISSGIRFVEMSVTVINLVTVIPRIVSQG